MSSQNWQVSNSITYKTCGTITQYSSQGLSSFLFSPQTPTTTAIALERWRAPSATRAAAASHGTSVLAFKARAPNSTRQHQIALSAPKLCLPVPRVHRTLENCPDPNALQSSFLFISEHLSPGRIILVLPPTTKKKSLIILFLLSFGLVLSLFFCYQLSGLKPTYIIIFRQSH